MAELNFGLLTPPGSENIGNAFLRGQDQARAAQMQDMQMQQSMRQGQREELQYKKMQTEEDNLNKFYSSVAENGGPKDPIAMEDQMIGSKVPHYVQLGYTLKTKRLALEQDRKRYAEANAPSPALGGVAPMAPAPGSFGAEVATRKAELFGPAQDRTNMMPGAAVAPTDVNALPATVAPQGGTALDALRARINANLALGTEQGNKTAENLQKQLTEATKLYPLGNVLMSGTGGIVGTAPQQPRQVNLATDLLIPGPNGTMVPNQALIKIKEGLRPPGTTVTVKTEQAYGGAVAAGAAKQDLAQIDRAQNLPQDFAKIDETLNILKNTDINTGLGADLFTVLDKARQQVTADKKAGKRAVNTEYLDSLLGSAVFPQIQALGIGARGMDTPAEREFLRKVMTGTVSLTKDTLIKMTELRRKGLETESELFNKRVEKGEFKPYEEAARRKVQAIAVPPMGVIFAVNPQTKARIQSTDGGQTWTPVGGT